MIAWYVPLSIDILRRDIRWSSAWRIAAVFCPSITSRVRHAPRFSVSCRRRYAFSPGYWSDDLDGELFPSRTLPRIDEISVDLIRMERMLHRYGLEAESARAKLRTHAVAKCRSFPDCTRTSRIRRVTLEMLEEIQDAILSLFRRTNGIPGCDRRRLRFLGIWHRHVGCWCIRLAVTSPCHF